MSEDKLLAKFKDDYRQDGLVWLVSSFLVLLCSIIILCALSLWFIFSKPAPVYFQTGEDWRIVTPVPINKPYISVPNLIQWVSDVLPKIFNVDFISYPTQLASMRDYFTAEGWAKFNQVIQKIASQEIVQKNKWFVSASANGAPYIVNQGMIDTHYGWWIQMPINLSYSSSERGSGRAFVIQVLVVRVPTLDDLTGIKIKNIIVKRAEGN